MNRGGLSTHPTDVNGHDPTKSTGAQFFDLRSMLQSQLTWLPDQFSNLIALHPEIGELFQKIMHDAKLYNIKSRDFKSHKERLIMLHFLLDQRQDLDMAKRQELIQLILLKDDLYGVRRVLEGPRAWWPSTTIRHLFTDEDLSPHKLNQQARSIASHTPDPDFLMNLKGIREDDETVKTVMADTEAFAYSYFHNTISKLLKKLVHPALRIQQDHCLKQIQRQVSSEASRDIDSFRKEFIRGIEELSQSESNLQVVPTCECFSSNVQSY
jgi:hypothetical protein